jgi:predicted transglutaminase-like cysteine proteinase
MVRLRISVSLKRSFRVLVILPLIITGLAIMCAAVPLMCLSSLTVLSIALKVSDHHYAESRLPSAQLLLWGDLRNGTTAGLASIPDVLQQGIQFISFESRFLSAQLLLRSDLRNGTTAGPASVPDVLQQGIQFIRFDVPTLAPMAFTQFCLKYASDCKPQRLLFRGDRLELNKMRWSELENINRTVNSSIHPVRNEDGLAGEKWLLGPVRGDCNDYAVTKRHQLITRGWSARTVLLSEVVTVSGEHHLVTIVRTNGGDLVLDNLTDRIMPWSRTPYRWVRIQTPKNPNYWASISEQNA